MSELSFEFIEVDFLLVDHCFEITVSSDKLFIEKNHWYFEVVVLSLKSSQDLHLGLFSNVEVIEIDVGFAEHYFCSFTKIAVLSSEDNDSWQSF